MPSFNAAQLSRLSETTDRIVQRIQLVVSPLDDARRQRNPLPGAWSVDQVLEHVCLLNAEYLIVIAKLLDGAAMQPIHATSAWKPTLAGRLLCWSLNPRSTMKLRSPKKGKPGPTPRAEVLERCVASMRELQQFMLRAGNLDLSAYTYRSPFASIMKMNLGDAFEILVVHAERHLGQIERTIAATA